MTRGAALLLVVLSVLALGSCTGVKTSVDDMTTTPNIIVPGDPLAGRDDYEASCSNCHGGNLEGVDGLGNVLAPNDFVTRTPDDQLVALIIIGRPRDHPDNITGVDMLPRGGNPSLSDQSIHDIVEYLKVQN